VAGASYNPGMSKDTHSSASEPRRESARLFDLPEDTPQVGKPDAGEVGVAKPRYQRAERDQVEMRFFALDALLPDDHEVRVVWQYVTALDLSPLYEEIRAVEGHAGRNPVDPRILMALWLFATIEGVSSARRLTRLCERDLPYMWICGGVGVNHDLLCKFRTAHPELLEQILIDNVAALMHQNLVSLKRVAQDGMRVRAHAGTSSFRGKATLEKCREEARQHLQEIQEENASDSTAYDERKKAARERAARERLERIEKAREEAALLEEQREKRRKGDGDGTRASTTDPEARKMKMANGGWSPAYNVQFATATDSRVIVGVDVTNSGNDGGQMAPMVEKIKADYGESPEEHLADGGFTSNDDITQLEKDGIQVIAPIRGEERQKAKGKDPYERQRRDTDEVFKWRTRMKTDEARRIYKERASTAEFPNAVCRNRGLHQFPVRGLLKAKSIALWHALCHNFTRMMSMGALPGAT
jgi:transposase